MILNLRTCSGMALIWVSLVHRFCKVSFCDLVDQILVTCMRWKRSCGCLELSSNF